VEWNNPYDVGMTGLIGFSSGYYAMLDCDVLLMLGTDFPYRQFYPQGAGVRLAQVAIRAENIGRRAPVDLGVAGLVRATLTAWPPLLQQKADGVHLARAREHYTTARKALDDLAAAGRGLIHPQQVAKAISDHAAADAVFTCDVGLPTVWAARYLAMNGRRRLIGSLWHGAAGTAVGASGRRPSRVPRSASGLVVGRRGLRDADGRFSHAHPTQASGKSRGVQQRHTRLRRAGAKVDRLPRFRSGPPEAELRGHGRGHRHTWNPDRRSGRGRG